MADIKIRLFITRHGITLENKLHILQGQIDTELDEEGISQSKHLGIRFTDYKFDFIYCSPLLRTLHTIKLALENMKYKTEPILDDRLKERGFGSWEGKKKEERVGPRPSDEESIQSVEKRVSSFFHDLGSSLIGQIPLKLDESQKHIPNILLVSHGATISCMERLLANLGAITIHEDRPLYNTCVSEYEILLDKKGVMKGAKCYVSRDVSHLGGFVLKWHK
ncbi:Bisphosphoglycerate-dependent phosphoglycerate mutase [Oopsacas minuta]|uniref:Bisphosphoglycerate-dependent phosphoglycerate mutase n=1 Tax=Oopsacas minuta TaxID=111878 RepID=A0AAV7KL12_9METZ|nr:Bisphosphoglycerate-dependent phosphoglycerate mutase [Oopsacas minuta]